MSDLDGLMGRIGEWRDDADAAASARARGRRYWLRRQAAEATTCAGVLLTLGECEAPVTIRTAGGQHRGTISSITGALCTLDAEGDRILIPLSAITAITATAPRPDGPAEISDDRLPTATADLATVLAELAPERPPVLVQLSDGSRVAGPLAFVGADVVGVGDRGITYVPLDAIACCVLQG